MRPVMYLFANRGLGMSKGKLGAQTAHAAVEAYQVSVIEKRELTDLWNKTGYTKLVLEARDTEHMHNIRLYLEDKGHITCSIIDEGRTETPPHSFTALGVPIVDKDDPQTEFAFGEFDLYPRPKWTDLADEVRSRQPSRWKRITSVW